MLGTPASTIPDPKDLIIQGLERMLKDQASKSKSAMKNRNSTIRILNQELQKYMAIEENYAWEFDDQHREFHRLQRKYSKLEHENSRLKKVIREFQGRRREIQAKRRRILQRFQKFQAKNGSK